MGGAERVCAVGLMRQKIAPKPRDGLLGSAAAVVKRVEGVANWEEWLSVQIETVSTNAHCAEAEALQTAGDGFFFRIGERQHRPVEIRGVGRPGLGSGGGNGDVKCVGA